MTMGDDRGAATSRMTIDAWRAEALRRGGGGFGSVRFLCPSCGNVATPDDFVAVGANAADAAVECIGRASRPMAPNVPGGRPCDWAAYGFFGTLGRGVVVEFPDGTTRESFAFAD